MISADKMAKVRNIINAWIITESLEIALNTQSPAAGFIVVSTGIDVLAGFRFGRKTKDEKTGEQFIKFVDIYMDKRYNPKELYKDLRCALVHNFLLGEKYGLLHRTPLAHFKEHEGKTLLNLEDFVEDFKKAANLYFSDLEAGKNVSEFETRFDSLGGIIDSSVISF